MLKGAVGAASVGDHVAVRDYLRERDRTAALTGDRWAMSGRCVGAAWSRAAARRRCSARYLLNPASATTSPAPPCPPSPESRVVVVSDWVIQSVTDGP